ncbi:hypothetical protein DMENIID0001_148510 [Sergentomyia squamirostris]
MNREDKNFPSAWETSILQNRRVFKVSREDGSSIGAISPMIILKAFRVAGDVDINRMRDGSLEIVAKNQQQAEKVVKIKKIGDVKVKVDSHQKKNTCKAIVRDEFMKFWDLQEILQDEDVKAQKVVDIKNIPTRKKSIQPRLEGAVGGMEAIIEHNNGKVPSDMFIVTFDLPVRPTELRIGYLVMETRDYYPDPMRCFKCQRFGHTSSRCTNSATCPRCAKPAHTTNRDDRCTEVAKCVNCGGPHPVYWRECPVLQTEKAIQKMKVMRKVPYPVAKRIVASEMSSGKTWSDIIRSKPRSECSGSCCDRCRQNVSVIQDPPSTKEHPDTRTAEGSDSSELPQRAKQTSNEVAVINESQYAGDLEMRSQSDAEDFWDSLDPKNLHPSRAEIVDQKKAAKKLDKARRAQKQMNLNRVRRHSDSSSSPPSPMRSYITRRNCSRSPISRTCGVEKKEGATADKKSESLISNK